MADRKKNRRRFQEDDKPTKEEYAVAKFLRFYVPTKEAKLHGVEVQCFFASAAIDALLESKWSASKEAKEPLFFNRNSCVNYCHRLMEKGLFHRAERVQRKKDKEKGDRSKKKKAKDTTEKEEGGSGDELRERTSKKEKKEKEDADTEKSPPGEAEVIKEEKMEEKTEEKTEEKKEEKKKEKPIKLVMTDDQIFLDGEENVYVWIYDPVHPTTLLIGCLIMLGAIALCLFPLWPEIIRLAVYYVSLAAGGFIGFILFLVVVRFVLYCAVWLVTLGRHRFWFLPKLTADVGFVESFQPLYQHDIVEKGSSPSSSTKEKKKSGKKSKKSSKKADMWNNDEGTWNEQEEFELIFRGDVDDEDEGEDRMEGVDEDSEENGEYGEEDDEYGAEEDEDEEYGSEEEEDYEEEEEGQDGALDENCQENDEGEEDEEKVSESKKDK